MAANPGRNARRYPLAWQASLGGLHDAGAVVHASCSTCGLFTPADLARMIKAKGRDFTLWDQSTPCRAPGCRGRVFFHARLSEGTPSRPLRS